GRLPGRLPRPGPPGPVDPRSRCARAVALRRRPARRPQGPSTTGPSSPDGGAWRRDPTRSPSRPPGRAGHWPRARRGAPPRDRTASAHLPPAGGPLLLRRALARRGGEAAPMPRRDAPQPPGPRPRAAPPRPVAPRRRALDDGPGGGPVAPIGPGVRPSPPVRFHDQGRDRLRGPARRRRRGPLGFVGGPGPGGPEDDDNPQAENRGNLRVPRGRRRRQRAGGAP